MVKGSFYIGIFSFLLVFSFGCKNEEKKTALENPTSSLLQVGVYNGNGASSVCVLETLEALKIDKGIEGIGVSPVDIQNGVLNGLDVLIFPGGSGSKEYNSLGQASSNRVKEFAMEKEKGIVGICAGGYLFATTEGYPSLEIIKAHTYRDHYNRGRGLIGFELTPEGREIFPELQNQDTLFVQYYDGPIYNVFEPQSMNVLGKITSDIATHENDPKGLTPGKPAFLTTNYGKAKVFVSVGHPESTPGMRWIVPRMARWVSNRELISYNKSVVRPEINKKEILYFPEQKSFEKKNFWNLFNEDDSEIIKAIDNLYSIRSRPSIRWSIGLLRHESPKVRLAAANYLLTTEYTYAIPDVATAMRNEQDRGTKGKLEAILKKLQAIRNE
ncbi:MAG: hypothetical protein GXO89_01890 [Chlorobi bacterium]|nr:hypothetical protein [Chlorobiota bacterium]